MREKLNSIRADVDEALKAVAEKHNLKFQIGSMRYSDTGFTTKLEASLLSESGGSLKEEADWKQAVALGLVEADWLGRAYDNNQFIIKAVELSRRKNCIIIERISTKKRFVTKPETVRRIIERDSK